jgi:hypothetical protein
MGGLISTAVPNTTQHRPVRLSEGQSSSIYG